MPVLLIMRSWKAHTIIAIGIIIYAIITHFRINPEDQFSVMNWFPVFLITGIYLGVIFVLYLLPTMVQTATDSVLGSNAEIENDPLHDARAAVARGDYQEAIDLYQKVLSEDAKNQQAWIDQANIQQKKLNNPQAAIETLQLALSSHDWPDNDEGYFMSRIADIQLNDLENKQAAVQLLQEIIDTFPNTRHSANATHKLHAIN